MEPEIYKFRLKKYYNTIVKDIEPKKILGFLYQSDIFNEDDMDDVRSERTRKKQAESMLSMLSRTGDVGYKVLVEALEETQPHLASLMKTPVPDEKLNDGVAVRSVYMESVTKDLEEVSLDANGLKNVLKKIHEPVEQGGCQPHPNTSNLNTTEGGLAIYSATDASSNNMVLETKFNLISEMYMPDKQDSVYKMTSSPRGLAVIVNMNTFDQKPIKLGTHDEKLENREGSEVDANNLEKLFKDLDLKVEMLIDKTKKQLMDELLKISKRDLKAYNCFVMCIMSHGKDDYFYSHDGGQIKILSIKKMFDNAECPTLCGKPKLFFIQACRGKATDFGRTVGDAPSENSENESASDTPSFISRHGHGPSISENADILLAYSSVEGYTSYRNTIHGSRFIRVLVSIFRNYAGWEDVESMMTRVIKEVNKDGELGAKQVPKPETTLTRKVFFWPGIKFD